MEHGNEGHPRKSENCPMVLFSIYIYIHGIGVQTEVPSLILMLFLFLYQPGPSVLPLDADIQSFNLLT